MIEKPVLFVPGAQKAGSTSLHAFLSRHPDIQSTEDFQELQFFALEDSVIEAEIDWYLSQSDGGREVFLDRSTFYAHTDGVARRIQKWCSDPYFLFILRDPAIRAFSAYRHMTKSPPQKDRRSFREITQKLSGVSFENLPEEENRLLREAVDDGLIDDGHIDLTYLRRLDVAEFPSPFRDSLWVYRYFSNSIYSGFIKEFEKIFGDRVFIISLEEFVRAPEKSLRPIFESLGIEADLGPSFYLVPEENQTRVHRNRLTKLIMDIFRDYSVGVYFRKFLGGVGGGKLLRWLKNYLHPVDPGVSGDLYRKARDILGPEYDYWRGRSEDFNWDGTK